MASVEATKRALQAAARAMDQLPHDADVSSVSVDLGRDGRPQIGYRVSAPLGPKPEAAADDEQATREHFGRAGGDSGIR